MFKYIRYIKRDTKEKTVIKFSMETNYGKQWTPMWEKFWNKWNKWKYSVYSASFQFESKSNRSDSTETLQKPIKLIACIMETWKCRRPITLHRWSNPRKITRRPVGNNTAEITEHSVYEAFSRERCIISICKRVKLGLSV